MHPGFCVRWLHHHVQNVDEFLGPRAAAEAEGAGSQQPVAQENVTAFNPIDPCNVLEIDNLGVLTTENALLEHLDTIGVDLNVFKPARTFVLEQQRVVVRMRHSRRFR